METHSETDIVELYLNGLSINELSRNTTISVRKINKILKNNNVKLRTKKEAIRLRNIKNIILTKELQDIICGELLGDGGFQLQAFQPNFYHDSKHKDYSQYLVDLFISYNVPLTYGQYNFVKSFYRFDKRYNKWHLINKMATACIQQFIELYKQWYGNNGIKHIPNDLEISPSLLLHWWLGDGHLHKVGNHGCLCSENFAFEDQKIMVDKINKKLKIDAKVVRFRNSYRIFIPKSSMFGFLEYIGNCPFPSLQYKWNLSPLKRKNKRKVI